MCVVHLYFDHSSKFYGLLHVGHEISWAARP